MNDKERTAIIEYAAQDVAALSAMVYNLGREYSSLRLAAMATVASRLVRRLEALGEKEIEQLEEEVSGGSTE